MQKFPYGISDFVTLRTENDLYVDRSDRIPLLEKAGRQLLFLRPRRFGKSLLLNMLANYYDIAQAERFDALFGNVHIGAHPTPLHNRYFVMTWDFSAVLPQEDVEQQKQTLFNYLNVVMLECAQKYRAYLPYPVQIRPSLTRPSWYKAAFAGVCGGGSGI